MFPGTGLNAKSLDIGVDRCSWWRNDWSPASRTSFVTYTQSLAIEAPYPEFALRGTSSSTTNISTMAELRSAPLCRHAIAVDAVLHYYASCTVRCRCAITLQYCTAAIHRGTSCLARISVPHVREAAAVAFWKLTSCD